MLQWRICGIGWGGSLRERIHWVSQLGVENVGVGEANWVRMRRHVSPVKNFAVVLQGNDRSRLALTGSGKRVR